MAPEQSCLYGESSCVAESGSGTYENTSQGQFLTVSEQGKSVPAPVLKASDAVTLEDTPVDIPVKLPAKYRCTVVEKAEHGSAKYDPVKRCMVYIPAENYNGKDEFSIIASDGLSETEPVRIAVKITPVEDIPVAKNQEFQLTNGQDEKITLHGYDPDGDKVTFRVVKFPKVGKLTSTPPNLTYSFKEFPGETQIIEFVVNDGKADSKVGKVSLVTPYKCPVATGPKKIDAKLDDWADLRFKIAKPLMIKHLDRKAWNGVKDCYFDLMCRATKIISMSWSR